MAARIPKFRNLKARITSSKKFLNGPWAWRAANTGSSRMLLSDAWSSETAPRFFLYAQAGRDCRGCYESRRTQGPRTQTPDLGQQTGVACSSIFVRGLGSDVVFLRQVYTLGLLDCPVEPQRPGRGVHSSPNSCAPHAHAKGWFPIGAARNGHGCVA